MDVGGSLVVQFKEEILETEGELEALSDVSTHC